MIMPQVEVHNASIFYQTYGPNGGPPLMLLHAGWGLPINGFEHQLATLGDRYRILIPHRRGYGRSSRVAALEAEYHQVAAADMLAVLDHAQASSAYLWGHSDGAVVGAWMAIMAPERVRALAFEGGHLRARKDSEHGQAYMERVRDRPETLPDEIQFALAAGHGTDYWKRLLWMWTEAWRLLYEQGGDVYGGRLREILCPVLVLHGAHDPHTSLAEMEQLAAQIQDASTLFFPAGGHSLHDDPELLDPVHAAVLQLFARVRAQD
jgi:pimeloyl-ACP methyl ester carboxylesterase